MRSAEPPRWSRGLLSLVVPGTLRGEAVLGDLEEEFHARAERSGVAEARRWYCRQALYVMVLYASPRRRRRGRAERHHSHGPVYRASGATSLLDDLPREVRMTVRGLVRDPPFALAVLVVLSVGIGSTTAIFAVAEGILLSPLPWPDDRELVTLCEESEQDPGTCGSSIPTTMELDSRARSLEGAGAYRASGTTWSLAEDGETTTISGGVASPGVFGILGARPALGRFFVADEIGPGTDDVAVLSHAFWMQRYGGDPRVLGRVLELDGEPVTVVGILPEGFEVPRVEWVTLWRPIPVRPTDEDSRAWRGFWTIARLADGASLARARSEVAALYAGIGSRSEAISADWRMRVSTLRSQIVGDARGPLVAFLAAAGILLLVVATNVASLLLARGVRKGREFAVRAALGARRGDLVGRILLESTVLTLLAGGAGLLLATWGVELFVALAPPGIPRLEQARVDLPVLLFATGVSVLILLMAGLVPALRLREADVSSSLRAGREGTETAGTARMRRVLVVAELALSLVLLFGTGLLVRTFQGYASWDPGFDRDGLYSAFVVGPRAEYPTRAEVMELWRRLEAALRAVPGVLEVGTASSVPLQGGRETARIRGEGMEGVSEEELPETRWYDVGPTYFATLGVPVVAGRGFTEADDAGAPRVALVNESFARRTWPGGPASAVGRWISPERDPLTQEPGDRFEVIGVVGDVPPLLPGGTAEPEVYWSNRQVGRWGTLFLVRVVPGTEEAPAAIRDRMLEAGPGLSAGTLQSLNARVDRGLATPRFNLWIMASFGIVATVLGLVGLYGVLAYDVARRARAIGIHLTLGSSPRRVVGRVLSEAGRLATLGVLLGAAGAWVMSGLLESMVQGVSTTDPGTLTAAAGLLAILALVAALGPALRAARLDPVSLLRR